MNEAEMFGILEEAATLMVGEPDPAGYLATYRVMLEDLLRKHLRPEDQAMADSIAERFTGIVQLRAHEIATGAGAVNSMRTLQ